METNPSLDTGEAEFTSTEWTDEKHSLYLKGMEATFVNQLYASTGFIGRYSRRDNSLDQKLPRQMHCNTSSLSGQFKVFRGGSWKKVSYGRNKGDDSHHLRANPWIQRFRPQAETDPTLQEATESMNCDGESTRQMFSIHSHGCPQNLEGSENEVSDQNFVGEDIEGEKESSTITPRMMKRLQMDDPENDMADSSS